MHTYKSLAAATLALLLLSACGSSGIGDVLGGGTGSNGQNYELRGTVDSVDPNSQSVYLTHVSGYTSMLSSGGDSVRVYYDTQTPVSYQGQTYRPEDLERGDQVTVRVDESGNRLIANSMTVTYNANNNSSSSSSGMYGSPIRGTVRYIDTSRRTIELDRGYASNMVTIVEFDTNTPVYFGNKTYRPADIERGDEIEVRTSRDLGNDRVLASDITVIRSVNGGVGSGTGSGSTSTSTSTIRGTVSYVDTNRRTIELQSTSWINGFDSGSRTSGTMIVQYDANTNVDVQGRLYPVSGLERGDVVEVRVRSLGGSSYFADRVVLVRDVNSR